MLGDEVAMEIVFAERIGGSGDEGYQESTESDTDEYEREGPSGTQQGIMHYLMMEKALSDYSESSQDGAHDF